MVKRYFGSDICCIGADGIYTMRSSGKTNVTSNYTRPGPMKSSNEQKQTAIISPTLRTRGVAELSALPDRSYAA